MKIVIKWVLRIVIGFLIASVGGTLAFKWLPVPVTPLMIKRCIQQKWNGKEMKLEKTWMPLEQISPKLQLAVVCTEDQHFLKHFGFDFEALKKAMKNNKQGKKLRGGSTISQQTAKNVFLWDGRSYIRKGLEAYFTLLIELFWSKERIMEVYLNVIEFGDGIYGAEAAAQHYFKKNSESLRSEQAATLACLLPNPREYGKYVNGKYIQHRKGWTLQQMKFWGGKLEYEDMDDEKEEVKEPIKKHKHKK